MNENLSGDRPPYRIFFLDDHPVVREGLRYLFEQDDRFTVVGEAEDAEGALYQIPSLEPDLALVDLRLGGEGMGGINLTRRLQRRCPSVRVVIISVHGDPYYVREALKAGAEGYVLKGSRGRNLLDAAWATVQNERYLDPGLPENL